MVVFEDGLARKSEYRRFAIRGLAGQDDTASMHEVITRRFRRYLEERAETGELDAELATRAPTYPVGIDPETGRPRKFAYPPNLVVVDGGPPQVAAAQRRSTSSASTTSRCAGWPSGSRRSGCPATPHPVILPRTSEGLYLLQRVRDEAHRFAITYHRQRRSKSMTASALDGVPGLGETRRKALLQHFGSLKRLARRRSRRSPRCPASGRHTAEAVVAALASRDRTAGFAVNTATGEILDDQTVGSQTDNSEGTP